ncbi:transcriptional regulator [Xylophilus rhododendri]|uniref:Transcriptional regulator n=1 Tax=Xylophilus rhododendri TaxID=2697032 RepID=A0A857J9F2_9BURK|nr:transcriptional regulator [Xylophilus rhododendri]QHJ00358.1 transcriptional regulator [Xylophilus rhododendri]
MEIQAVKDEASYRAALAEIDGLMTARLDTPEGDRLDVLVTLVQAYEARHHPIDPPDPIDAIRFRMEQGGLTVADMTPYIGPPHRVYEVLNRKRPLTLNMIRRLAAGLHIPADVLIGPYGAEAKAA